MPYFFHFFPHPQFFYQIPSRCWNSSGVKRVAAVVIFSTQSHCFGLRSSNWSTLREGAGFIKAGYWLASDPSPLLSNPTGCTLGGSKARSSFPKHGNEDVNGSWQDGFYPSGVLRVSGPLMESSTGHLQILVLILTAQEKHRPETQTCPWTAIRPQALVASLCSRRYLNNSSSSLLSHVVVQFVVPSLLGEDLFSFFSSPPPSTGLFKICTGVYMFVSVYICVLLLWDT